MKTYKSSFGQAYRAYRRLRASRLKEWQTIELKEAKATLYVRKRREVDFLARG